MRFHHLVVRCTYFSIICANEDSDNKGSGVHGIHDGIYICSFCHFLVVMTNIVLKWDFRSFVDFSYYAIPVPTFSPWLKGGYLKR